MQIKNIIITLFFMTLLFQTKTEIKNPSQYENSPIKYNGYVFNSGYMEISDSDREIVISNYSELKNYCDKYNTYSYDEEGNKVSGHLDYILNKYYEDFFDTHSLAMQYIELSSGSISVQFTTAYKTGNGVFIEYRENIPEIGTCDMSGCLIIVEVDKDVTQIVNNKIM